MSAGLGSMTNDRAGWIGHPVGLGRHSAAIQFHKFLSMSLFTSNHTK